MLEAKFFISAANRFSQLLQSKDLGAVSNFIDNINQLLRIFTTSVNVTTKNKKHK